MITAGWVTHEAHTWTKGSKLKIHLASKTWALRKGSVAKAACLAPRDSSGDMGCAGVRPSAWKPSPTSTGCNPAQESNGLGFRDFWVQILTVTCARLGGFGHISSTPGALVSSMLFLNLWTRELTWQWVQWKEHPRSSLQHTSSCLCIPITRRRVPGIPCTFALGSFREHLSHSALYFPFPFPRPALWIGGWLWNAHRDEHHARNAPLILADGKNKGLPFSKNNVAGRKASNGKKMEVVLGADWYPTAPFPPPPWVCPKGEWARADRRGKVTFSYFVRTNANTTMCLCVHVCIK